MLVLRREVDEEIVLTIPASNEPTQIIVALIDIRYGQHPKTAGIGFDAPADVVIHRKEIMDRIARGESRK